MKFIMEGFLFFVVFGVFIVNDSFWFYFLVLCIVFFYYFYVILSFYGGILYIIVSDCFLILERLRF